MRRLFGVTVTWALLSATLVASAQDAPPKHLLDARILVERVELRNTSYEHAQGTVVWSGTAESHTDCSGLVDHLLMHSYGYTPDAFKRWFDSHRPTAARYHDAIEAQKGFVLLPSVLGLRPGDLIAIRYLVEKSNTGHIMLVADTPRRMAVKKPLVAGAEQWAITVIDSSESGHGPTDTRHKRGPGGKDHEGLGEGIFRLYTTRDGQIVGFAWSTLSVSKFVPPEEEHVVLGRLVPDYRP
ncbi:MAG TPA: hypothetical protein VMS64_16605 [Candidatus Methylomirabilis sp.]|nr:hypothetical protein [Candidatus Methylomirabilis sp.]